MRFAKKRLGGFRQSNRAFPKIMQVKGGAGNRRGGDGSQREWRAECGGLGTFGGGRKRDTKRREQRFAAQVDPAAKGAGLIEGRIGKSTKQPV